MTPQDTMRLALEALEESDDYLADCDIPQDRKIRVVIDAAIESLREALSQQGEQPVAWVLEWTFNGEEKGRRLYDDETHCKFDAGQDGGICRPLVYGDAAAPAAQTNHLQDIAAFIGVGGYNGATDEQLVQRIHEEFVRLTPPAAQPETWTDDGGWTFPVERQIIQTR